MASDTSGHVDFGDEGFIVGFKFDPNVVARLKQIQRRRVQADGATWVVASHWPSARRLLHIASDLGWTISARAREAEARLKSEDEDLGYSIDVVHDNHGKAWFQCNVGSDDVLTQEIRALPGASWDGSWWVPTDWEQCCGPLLELVQAEMQLEVSNAAWRLLEEPDVEHLYVRSSAPQGAATPRAALAAVPLEQERQQPATDPGHAEAAADEQATPSGRRPRVTTRSHQPLTAVPAKKQAG